MSKYGKYFDNIHNELSLLWKKHLKQIVGWYRNPKGKIPKAVKKHKKLTELYWRSAGQWKKGDRG